MFEADIELPQGFTKQQAAARQIALQYLGVVSKVTANTDGEIIAPELLCRLESELAQKVAMLSLRYGAQSWMSDFGHKFRFSVTSNMDAIVINETSGRLFSMYRGHESVLKHHQFTPITES